MKRSIVIASCAIVIALVACAELFDEPSQCKSDRDCTKFGGVCDVTRAVCVPAPVIPTEGGTTGDSSIADATDEAPPPLPGCDVAGKDTSEIPTTALATAGESEIGADVTLDCTKDWILKDRTFVKTGVTVKIEPNTRILAFNGAGLIVRPGGKLDAKGFRDQPIVFTASGVAPAVGSWRGLFVLGAAPPMNAAGFGADAALAYGGSTAADSSGTLEFVRVEYSQTGLVLAGVGSGTKIDHVQVRRTTDNCYGIAGGRFDAKHLVCQFPADEMFEISSGYQGRMQFVFGQKTPAGGGHHGFLVENNALATVFNATLCGDGVANQGHGLVLRNTARIDLANGIFTGWSTGLDVVGATGTPFGVRNSIFAGNANNPAFAEVEAGANNLADDDNGFDEAVFLEDGGTNSLNSAGLVACHDANNPQPWPPAAINGATPPSDGFFDTNASFVGAFRDQNDGWMKGNWIKLSDP